MAKMRLIEIAMKYTQRLSELVLIAAASLYDNNVVISESIIYDLYIPLTDVIQLYWTQNLPRR